MENRNLMQLEKIIREERTEFDKTVIASKLLDILSGYKHLEAVQELIKTLLSYAVESLKAGELPETVLLSVPSFYRSILLFYATTIKQEEPSMVEELFNLEREEQDPRLLAMEDTRFIVGMVREVMGRGISEERRKLLLDKMLVQVFQLLNHRGIAAEHRQYLNKFAGLLRSSGQNERTP